MPNRPRCTAAIDLIGGKDMKRLSALAKAINSKGGRSAPRYLAVVLGGFIVDFSIAWLTHELLGFPLIGAATLGFMIAMTLSYFAHEFWTIQRASRAASPTRFVKFVMASGATLGTRLVLVWLTGFFTLMPGGALARLLIAYGGSLVVGFLVNRGVVFSDADETEQPKL
jgi:putative flippase GtrA